MSRDILIKDYTARCRGLVRPLAQLQSLLLMASKGPLPPAGVQCVSEKLVDSGLLDFLDIDFDEFWQAVTGGDDD